MINYHALFVYACVMAFTPGPNNIMAMSCAGTFGLRKSIKFNIGVMVGFSVVMLLCTAFGATLYAYLPSIKPVMQVIGAGYMLYLAWKILRSSNEISQVKGKAPSIATGAMMQFINPKCIIYCITVTSTYILPYTDSWPLMISLAIGLAGISFTATVCWSVFGSAFSKLFSRYGKVLNIILALLLLYTAVSLFL